MNTCKECLRIKPPYRRERCGACYLRWRDANPHLVKKRQPRDVLFWQKVSKSEPNGCWEWTAGLDHAGYGKCARMPELGTKTQKAHRVAYLLLIGPIPNGLDLDHLCRNRACVNPSHLEPVTRAENHRRRAAAQTHCINGHEFNEANTYRYANGDRSCRTCGREQTARRRKAVAA